MVARIEPGRGPMLLRIAQVQVAIVFGLEVNNETVIVDLLDDVGHVDQLAQRFAGYRVGSFNAIHLRSPSYESAAGPFINLLPSCLKRNSVIRED